MHKIDQNRVVFYPREDLMSSIQLKKGEAILRVPTKDNYSDINDILELCNIKKFIDNELYLQGWTPGDIEDFKQKGIEYAKAIGQFMSKVDDSNVVQLFDEVSQDYIKSFLELINSQSVFKRISNTSLNTILLKEPRSPVHTMSCSSGRFIRSLRKAANAANTGALQLGSIIAAMPKGHSGGMGMLPISYTCQEL